MKPLFTLLGIHIFFILSVSAATTFTTASQDTFITIHPGLGGPGSIHGSETSLYSVSDGASPGYDTDPVFRFDLSAYAGATVTGSGTITLTSITNVTGSLEYVLYPALVPWSEAAASWNSFGGFPSSSFFTVSAATGTLVGGTGSQVTFTISQSMLQSWIDSPGTNYGVLMHGTTNWTSSNGFSDRQFVSREGGTGAPTLTFATSDAPEPARFAMVAAGLAGAVYFRRRRA